MNEFKSYHPIVNFIYFVFAIGFSCLFLHPVSLVISLVSGFTYYVMLKGGKKKNLIYMLLIAMVTALINPLFNHQGITIITYLPGGNPLTMESVIYGLCAGGMIVSVICHFSCYNEIMTSDKFIYLFGKAIPSMSLVFSMTLRFVPRFFSQLKTVSSAQKCMGRNISEGSIKKRAECGLNILSIMTTLALENAIETADSMKSRGYGLPGRTAYSIYKFDKRDKIALISMLLLGAYTFIGYIIDGMYISFFPSIKTADFSIFGTSVFLAYLLLLASPVIIEVREVRSWKSSERKI